MMNWVKRRQKSRVSGIPVGCWLHYSRLAVLFRQAAFLDSVRGWAIAHLPPIYRPFTAYLQDE